MKIGPVDAVIYSVDLKKGKKLRKVKYIARSASVPSGLNKNKRNKTKHCMNKASNDTYRFVNLKSQHTSFETSNGGLKWRFC